MGKWVVVLLALVGSTLAVTAVGRTLPQPYHVTGRVYCDTCRCGFETNITSYIPGATVELQCTDKTSASVVYKDQATTDKTGTFKFIVKEDHEEQYCDTVLVKSPWSHCQVADPGRSRSRVIVTDSNGIISYHRYANAMGFFQDQALPPCGELLQYYLHFDDDE